MLKVGWRVSGIEMLCMMDWKKLRVIRAVLKKIELRRMKKKMISWMMETWGSLMISIRVGLGWRRVDKKEKEGWKILPVWLSNLMMKLRVIIRNKVRLCGRESLAEIAALWGRAIKEVKMKAEGWVKVDPNSIWFLIHQWVNLRTKIGQDRQKSIKNKNIMNRMMIIIDN